MIGLLLWDACVLYFFMIFLNNYRFFSLGGIILWNYWFGLQYVLKFWMNFLIGVFLWECPFKQMTAFAIFMFGIWEYPLEWYVLMNGRFFLSVDLVSLIEISQSINLVILSGLIDKPCAGLPILIMFIGFSVFHSFRLTRRKKLFLVGHLKFVWYT